jgi:hypothetical protein
MQKFGLCLKPKIKKTPTGAKIPMKALLENSECNPFHREFPFEKSKWQLDEEKTYPCC